MNISSQNKKHKSNLLSKIDELDRKAEIFLLSPKEEDLRHHLKEQLTKLLREEIYWLQRSKTTKLLQGDDYTKYFHLVANGRHRKTKIVQQNKKKELLLGMRI